MSLYKKIRYLLSPLLLLVVGVFCISSSSLWAKDNKRLTILFTNDLHSSVKSKGENYAEKFVDKNGDTVLLVGGYAKLATLIKQERQKAEQENSAVILVDAGDIAIGSIFHALYTKEAVEYNMLAKLGYNAYTFGNHDFDFGIDTLLKMFKVANFKNSAAGFPSLLCSNLEFKELRHKKSFTDVAHLQPYKIYNYNGLKVGVFGLMGENAYSVISSDDDKITYKNPIKVAKCIVKELKDKKVDYIVAISHGGTTFGPDREYTERERRKSQDGALARKVDGIDVIISGHDHERLEYPLNINGTIIGTSGTKGTMLGKIVVEKDSNNTLLVSYDLIPVSNKVEDDVEISQWVDTASVKVKELFLSGYKFSPFDTVTVLAKNYEREVDSLGNMELGEMIAESYREAALEYFNGEKEEKIIGLVPFGTVRGNLNSGVATYNNVFNVLSLGYNNNGFLGYPLVYAWLSGREVKNLCELVESIGPKMEDTRLFFSGVNYKYNKDGLIFYKVSDVFVHGKPIEKDSLYMVVTCRYTANLIKLLKSESFGILSAVPKNKKGVVLKNFNNNILKDSLGNEVTGWVAFSKYLKYSK